MGGAGHIFLLYLKFYCEPNRIEYCWGSFKYFARNHCNYTVASKLRVRVRWGTECWFLSLAAGLRKVVPQALESVRGSSICKYWERTQRILQAYREEVHRSHRRV